MFLNTKIYDVVIPAVSTNCTFPPFLWTLSIICLTSSAYAVAGSGWFALYLPLYTSGLGAWIQRTRHRIYETTSLLSDHGLLYFGLSLSYPHTCAPPVHARVWALHSRQSPVLQLESWRFDSVQAGRRGEKKHSPHGQMGSAQRLTAGGTCMDWCQWAMRRGRGTHCKHSTTQVMDQISLFCAALKTWTYGDSTIFTQIT